MYRDPRIREEKMARTKRVSKSELGEILRAILELWHWQGELIQAALREVRAGGRSKARTSKPASAKGKKGSGRSSS